MEVTESLAAARQAWTATVARARANPVESLRPE
jgi:hypothetical protein